MLAKSCNKKFNKEMIVFFLQIFSCKNYNLMLNHWVEWLPRWTESWEIKVTLVYCAEPCLGKNYWGMAHGCRKKWTQCLTAKHWVVHTKRDSISPSSLVLYWLLHKDPTKKKTSTSFTLPIIHGIKWSKWHNFSHVGVGFFSVEEIPIKYSSL